MRGSSMTKFDVVALLPPFSADSCTVTVDPTVFSDVDKATSPSRLVNLLVTHDRIQSRTKDLPQLSLLMT
jgi:hypothetical protein